MNALQLIELKMKSCQSVLLLEEQTHSSPFVFIQQKHFPFWLTGPDLTDLTDCYSTRYTHQHPIHSSVMGSRIWKRPKLQCEHQTSNKTKVVLKTGKESAIRANTNIHTQINTYNKRPRIWFCFVLFFFDREWGGGWKGKFRKHPINKIFKNIKQTKTKNF